MRPPLLPPPPVPNVTSANSVVAALPAPATRDAPLPPDARAAPQPPAQQAAAPIPSAPHTVHRQLASRVAQLNPAQSASHSHARAIRDIRDVSPFPPVGSPAVLPQQPRRRSIVRRKKRRNTRALVAQPLAPTAQSIQVPRPPPLINLRISAPPSPIPRVAPPPLPNRRAPLAIAQQPASAQPHLDVVRKRPRTVVRIIIAVEDTSMSPPSPPSPPRATRSMNAPVKKNNSRVAATSTLQYIGASAASAASLISYCYAVALRSHDEDNRSSYALLLRPAVYNTQLELRHRAVNLVACTMACAQEFEGARAERTRVACASKQPFPGTACTDRTRSSTPAQLHALAVTSLLRTELQSAIATHSLTPTVFSDWQHLHLLPVAQCCNAAAHAPSDVQNCTPQNLRAHLMKIPEFE